MKQNRKTVVPQQPANLEESGRKFLQTPPEDLAEPEISRGPVLDDSSAYQFEMSKKAISKQNSMKRTRMDIKDLVEPSSIEHGAIAHTPRSVKRKAEDISQTTAEEETFTSATGFKHARAKTETAPLPTNQSISCTQSPRGALQAKMSTDLPRPHKKIRRAAEVFGYAALGGLAVMSALIATAPAL
jgi:NADH:ubiquinone oxidoreductase subunit D